MASTVDDTPALDPGGKASGGRVVGEDGSPVGACRLDGGRRKTGQAQYLFSGPEMPTAVFCFNDQVAMGIYQGAAARGLRVPDDVSIVGVDNLEIIAAGLDPGSNYGCSPALPDGVVGDGIAGDRVGR